MIRVRETDLPGVLVIEPRRFEDERGYFFEVYHSEKYAAAGIGAPFVQDNVSFSRRGVLRGLHYQHPHGQAKLIHVLAGSVFDVAVDVRAGSPTFGRWTSALLSGDNGYQLYIPAGFAHGFCTLSETALFAYKCTTPYHPEAEGVVRWSDPDIGIDWPAESPSLSDRDREAPLLSSIDPSRLPAYRLR